MAGPPTEPPESIVMLHYGGIKNTVRPERLAPDELEAAVNIDLDDVGEPSRRRGYTQRDNSSWHSVKTQGGKVFGVRNGLLGIIRPDFSFSSLAVNVGTAAVCYTHLNEETYFSSTAAQGVVDATETVQSWGATLGQGEWQSPVIAPTVTLGAISGQLMGDPPVASAIEAYNGRIYLAHGKTLWATELFRYHYVDRTKNYLQFEDDITMLAAMVDGLYVGTTKATYFLKGRMLAEFQLIEVTSSPTLPGSEVWVPADLVHPQAQNAPIPTGDALVFMTEAGVCAGFDGGTLYNLTQAKVVLPRASSAAALFRQLDGVNTYVAVTDSAGTPTASARIGDYVDAEIVRFQGG